MNLLQDLEGPIIGALLTKPEALPLVAELSPEDFSEPITRDIFKSIRGLYCSGKAVDRITVESDVGHAYQEFLGVCCQIASVVPKEHAEILKREVRLAAIRALGEELTFSTDLDHAAERIAGLNQQLVESRKWTPTPMSAALADFVSRHEGKVEPDYLSFGFSKLDLMTYVEAGDFVVIGGEPSSGKTMLATIMATHIAKKKRVGFFSLETTARKLTDRIISQQTSVPMRRIKLNTLEPADGKAIAKASSELAKLDLDIWSAAGMTVADIQALTMAHRYDVIFIDYLQIINDSGKTRYEQVTNISMQLHAMAQKNGITVIALAQLSRPERAIKNPPPPSMNDLRESGQIEQDADAVLILYRKERNSPSSPRILKVAKNKEGSRGQIELDFDGETVSFSEARPTYAPNPNKKDRRTRDREPDWEAMENAGIPVIDDRDGPLPF